MLKRVLSLLKRLSLRPAMYVQPMDSFTIQSYLRGLQAGCAFGGLPITREVYKAAAAARGWKMRPAGIVWHMRAKKLDDPAIIQELIAVEIEAYRRAATLP